MRLALLLFALTLPLTARANPPLQSEAARSGIVSLDSLRGLACPLLIFAPKPDDSQLEIQLRRIHEVARSIAGHNIVVIAILYDSPSPTRAVLTDNDAQAARRRFNVAPNEFTVILLGKDGGVKLRSSKTISVQKLRDAVDGIPNDRE